MRRDESDSESEPKIETDASRNASQKQTEMIISHAKRALDADKASPSRGTAPAAPHTETEIAIGSLTQFQLPMDDWRVDKARVIPSTRASAC